MKNQKGKREKKEVRKEKVKDKKLRKENVEFFFKKSKKRKGSKKEKS